MNLELRLRHEIKALIFLYKNMCFSTLIKLYIVSDIMKICKLR